MNTITLVIPEMHCTACVMTIDGALEDLAGVVQADTSFVHGRSTIVYDPHQITPEAMVAALRDAGYQAELLSTPGRPSRS